MFVTMRTYKIVRGEAVDSARIVQGGFVGEIERLPGFRAYYLIEDPDGKRLGSVSVFDNRESAAESDRIAAEWVKAQLQGVVLAGTALTEGRVLVSSVRHGEPAVA